MTTKVTESVYFEESKCHLTELDVAECVKFNKGYVFYQFVTNNEKLTCKLEDLYVTGNFII
ncbi:MAG: hypothetical protein ACTS4V_01560 [Candidatus Hodgkinia cicadicola]